MEKIKDYFDRYPQSQEVFENEGVLFHTRGAAESYGTGEYTRHTRKQVDAAAKGEAADGEKSASDLDETETATVAATEPAKEEDVDAEADGLVAPEPAPDAAPKADAKKSDLKVVKNAKKDVAEKATDETAQKTIE